MVDEKEDEVTVGNVQQFNDPGGGVVGRWGGGGGGLKETRQTWHYSPQKKKSSCNVHSLDAPVRHRRINANLKSSCNYPFFLGFFRGQSSLRYSPEISRKGRIMFDPRESPSDRDGSPRAPGVCPGTSANSEVKKKGSNPWPKRIVRSENDPDHLPHPTP